MSENSNEAWTVEWTDFRHHLIEHLLGWTTQEELQEILGITNEELQAYGGSL